MQVKTIEQAIDFSYPQLSKIRKEAGDTVVKTVLIEALSDLVMFFNVGKTMNSAQVLQTVDLILDQYWYLRLSEFKYCFNKAKLGAYGKVYDRIDGAVIFGWIELYLTERKDAVIEANIKRNNEFKKDTSILSALSDKGVNFNSLHKISENKHQKSESEKENVIQAAFKEFDELYKNNAIESNYCRMIKYEGKELSMIEFSEMRLNQYYQEKSK